MLTLEKESISLTVKKRLGAELNIGAAVTLPLIVLYSGRRSNLLPRPLLDLMCRSVIIGSNAQKAECPGAAQLPQ